MKLIDALRAKAQAALDEQTLIAQTAIEDGDRALTAEEQTAYDAAEKAYTKANADLNAAIAREDRATALAAMKPKAVVAEVVNPDVKGVVKAITQAVNPALTIVGRPELTLAEKMGLSLWCAAKSVNLQKHGQLISPLEIMKAFGFERIADECRGVRKQVDDETPSSVQKTLTSLSNGGADNMLYTPLLQDFIVWLRNASSYIAAGPNQIEMPLGTLAIAAAASGTTAAYGVQDTDIGYSDITTAQVTLSAKNLRVISAVTNQALETSPLAVMSILGDDLLRAMANAVDNAGLRGTGSGANPKGIKNVSGISTHASVAVSPKAPTIAEVSTNFQNVIQDLAANNIPVIRRRFIMANRTLNYIRFLKTTVGNDAFPSTLDFANPTILGIPIIASEQVPTNLGGGTDESEIYHADWGHLFMGITRSIRMDASTEASYVNGSSTLVSAYSRDETAIRCQASHDFGTRYPKAISMITAVRWGAP